MPKKVVELLKSDLMELQRLSKRGREAVIKHHFRVFSEVKDFILTAIKL
jgi:hypothetical protein